MFVYPIAPSGWCKHTGKLRMLWTTTCSDGPTNTSRTDERRVLCFKGWSTLTLWYTVQRMKFLTSNKKQLASKKDHIARLSPQTLTGCDTEQSPGGGRRVRELRFGAVSVRQPLQSRGRVINSLHFSCPACETGTAVTAAVVTCRERLPHAPQHTQIHRGLQLLLLLSAHSSWRSQARSFIYSPTYWLWIEPVIGFYSLNQMFKCI